MPIIKSAKKKLKQDKKKAVFNKKYEIEYKKLINQARKHKKSDTAKKTQELLKKAYSANEIQDQSTVTKESKTGR